KGKRQGEGRAAFVGQRAHGERASVRLGDRAREEQSQPGAGLGRVADLNATELLEDQTLVLARDPGPVIADLDLQAPARAHSLDFYILAGARVLDGVVDQVDENLAEPVPVAPNAGKRLPDDRADRDLVLAALGGASRGSGALGETHVFERVAEGPGPDPRRVRTAPRQLGEPRRFMRDEAQE